MIFIGIDPGMAGGVGVIHDGIVKAIDTPVIKPAKGKSEYDLQGMVRILMNEAALTGIPCHCIIESVHAMPKQGVTSSFRFGTGFGMWLGMLGALQIPFSLVTPQRWKKSMLADMGADKDLARLRAQQLFPKSAGLFTRKKDDGRAEAVLMAEYGRRLLSGGQEIIFGGNDAKMVDQFGVEDTGLFAGVGTANS